ncbi:MAG: hypothetical protein JXA39_08970 [Bacteroidales bacterium]|nr:hypothetical protein [Bacteroidales bacterium]
MNSESFIKFLNSEQYTEEDLNSITDICRSYPMFNLAHMLKIRILDKLGREYGDELKLAAIYSSDRGRLYKFVGPGEQKIPGDNHAEQTEEKTIIQFSYEDPNQAELIISNNDDDTISSEQDLLEIDKSEEEEDDDNISPIREKEDADMEEPEGQDEPFVPSIDLIGHSDEGEAFNEQYKDRTPEDSAADGPEEQHYLENGQPTDPDSREPNPDKGPVSESDFQSGQERKGFSVIQPGNEKDALITKFISNDPGPIKPGSEVTIQGDVSLDSTKENDHLITDTLAKIYVKQGLHAKAIYAYERLSLKFPEKSAYFAAQIEKIKNITNS